MNRNRKENQSADWQALALALVLVATGAILVGGDLLGMLSLDGIRNLWPVSLIVLGAVDLLTSDRDAHAVAETSPRSTHARQL